MALCNIRFLHRIIGALILALFPTHAMAQVPPDPPCLGIAQQAFQDGDWKLVLTSAKAFLGEDESDLNALKAARALRFAGAAELRLGQISPAQKISAKRARAHWSAEATTAQRH